MRHPTLPEEWPKKETEYERGSTWYTHSRQDRYFCPYLRCLKIFQPSSQLRSSSSDTISRRLHLPRNETLWRTWVIGRIHSSPRPYLHSAANESLVSMSSAGSIHHGHTYLICFPKIHQRLQEHVRTKSIPLQIYALPLWIRTVLRDNMKLEWCRVCVYYEVMCEAEEVIR